MVNQKIRRYIEKITGKPISTQQRFNWDDYQFTYYFLSRGMVNSIRILLE